MQTGFPCAKEIIMQITEKDIQISAKNKQKKKRSWLKVLLIIIAIWLSLAIVVALSDNDESSTFISESLPVTGFSEIYYGMDRHKSIDSIKTLGWEYKQLEQKSDRGEKLEIAYFTVSDGNDIINGIKTDFLGLGFNQENILVMLVLAYRSDNSEKTRNIFGKMIDNNGFKLLAGPIRSPSMNQYWSQNSDGNLCIASDSGKFLELRYASKYYSDKLIKSIGGKKEFRNYLKQL